MLFLWRVQLVWLKQKLLFLAHDSLSAVPGVYCLMCLGKEVAGTSLPFTHHFHNQRDQNEFQHIWPAIQPYKLLGLFETLWQKHFLLEIRTKTAQFDSQLIHELPRFGKLFPFVCWEVRLVLVPSVIKIVACACEISSSSQMIQ